MLNSMTATLKKTQKQTKTIQKTKTKITHNECKFLKNVNIKNVKYHFLFFLNIKIEKKNTKKTKCVPNEKRK